MVILSSNDGCIIARSSEAKSLGIPMGAPYFQWEEFCKRKHVSVLSSNYALYGDLSFRVMQTLETFHPDLEIYSIDEAFLSLSADDDPVGFAHFLRQKVIKWTGIPISIGIGPTKTLAKVANRIAKKESTKRGICSLITQEQQDKALELLPVEEVWGIGRRIGVCLQKRGIYTAHQLTHQSDEWVRKTLTVTGLRTVWELRGISCLGMDEAPAAKQSIMTSRSFGRAIIDKRELEEAVATFASRGAEKLREEGRLATCIQVFIMTSPHKLDEPYYANAASLFFTEPTAYTPSIIAHAKNGLETIYREGLLYKKAGVLLSHLLPESLIQQDFLASSSDVYTSKKRDLMKVIDHLNTRMEGISIQFGAEGLTHPWKRERKYSSNSFTTSWEELLTIEI